MTAEKLKYRAKINAKGLDTTGVSEEHARLLASNLGTHIMLIAEARSTTVITDEEGNQQVALILTNVEPVPAVHEDTVREFQRSLYRSRPEVEGQAVLSGVEGGGMSVEDAASQLAAQTPTAEPAEDWDGDTDAPLTSPAEGSSVMPVDFSGR